MAFEDVMKMNNLPQTFSNNPNTEIAKTASQGIGSGNGVQSAQAVQNNMSTNRSNVDFTQNPLDILTSLFPNVNPSTLQDYTPFIAPISQELYDAADPNNAMYNIQFQERAGFAGDVLDMRRGKAMNQIYSAADKFRGSAGKRGTGLNIGRDFMGELSREASFLSEDMSGSYGKSLYDITSSIVDEINRNKQLVSQAEATRRQTAMQLAGLGEFFVPDPNADNNPYSNLPEGMQSDIMTYLEEQAGDRRYGWSRYEIS